MNDFAAFVPGPRCRVEPKASGPLSGLNFAAKDLFDVAGWLTGAGNPDWLASQEPAARNAAAIDRLLLAGARLIGKTMTDELAFSLEGENAHYGTPINPAAPDRLPGGSSSGSAVAVAAGLCDLALGTDTGGSVRVPASFCGIYGYRPTHGRVPLRGVVPFAPSYDTAGLFARDAALLAKAGQILLDDGSPPLPARRLLIARDAFALAEPEAAAALLNAVRGFGAAEEIDIFCGEQAHFFEAYRVLQGDEIRTTLGPWIKSAHPRFGAAIGSRFEAALAVAPAMVAHFQAVRARIAARLRRAVAPGSIVLAPTAPGPALHRQASQAERAGFYQAALTLTSIAGHAGLPALSMPAAAIGGLPLGLSLIGAPHADLSLLAATVQLAERGRTRLAMAI